MKAVTHAFVVARALLLPPLANAAAQHSPPVPHTTGFLPLLGILGMALLLLVALLLRMSALFRDVRPPTMARRSDSLRSHSS
jgi:hypothetical protein